MQGSRLKCSVLKVGANDSTEYYGRYDNKRTLQENLLDKIKIKILKGLDIIW